jgi:tripartite-type tricarboxylate transporter receptor subunit TctC
MKNSLRVYYKGAYYIIANLTKEQQEDMRVEIEKAVKDDEMRRKLREKREQPKVEKKGAK